MKFGELAEYFSRLEKTSSRLAMTEILAELFKKASVDEIGEICYLSLGRLVPLYERLEFNLAEKMAIRSIGKAFGKENGEIQKLFKKVGDLGEVVESLKTKGKQSNLSVLEVYKRLEKIAKDEGQGSQERKVGGLAELLSDLDGLSGRYVVRIVVRKLRLGFSDKTMIDGLSWMKKGDKSLRDEIEKAYFVRADIGEIARRFKKKGLKELVNYGVLWGVPVMPALCQRLKTAEEMIAKMGKVAVEPKWDGTRVQIHYKAGGEIKAFTRNMDEVTHMFPELKEIEKQIEAKEVIIDSEAVGIDPNTKKLLSFQQTIVRKRKHGVEEISKKVPLKFFVFDVLYENGKSLINTALNKRRKILERLITGNGVLEVSEQIVIDDAVKLRDYHTKKLKAGLEGAVVKKWNDVYVPGRRGWSWVKFKEVAEAVGKLADTLDCVVMGFYRGKGKRAQFGIGAFLVGVRSGEKLMTVAKIGTGLSDKQWREMKKRLDGQVSVKKPKDYDVHKQLEPDVWVNPMVVVEIAADEITKSPTHSAGLALRFPRLIRFRDDKKVSQATSLSELKEIK